MTAPQVIAVGLLVAAATLNAIAFLSWRRARKAWEQAAERNRRTSELNAEGLQHLAAARKALAEGWRALEASRAQRKEHIS